MNSFKRDKKEEEDGGGNPFQNIEKTSVLQDARYFNETPVNNRKCTHILTKILYLLNQGEQLSTQEATEAFFAMTKLFQSKDVILRRMVYLGIKELSSTADDVIIVTSSLTKDMTGKEDLYRAAAIRALCSITDSTMLQAIERYMKQAIIDKSPAVSSAALVSALHLTSVANDLVRRWANEAQFSIGRALSNKVVLPHLTLSRMHCHMRKDSENSWSIQDLSSFGCNLNAAKMEKSKVYALKDGDVIQLDASGDFVYEYKLCCTHKDTRPSRKRKMEETDGSRQMIEVTKKKFIDSQSLEVEQMENKIKTAHLQNESAREERDCLQYAMQKEIEELNEKYAKEIECLKGEKEEVQELKNNLDNQRKQEVMQCEKKMKLQISSLEDKILQQTQNEEKLQIENRHLSERLKQERIDFEKMLAEENVSKHFLLHNLELKLSQLENERLRANEIIEREIKEKEFLKAEKDRQQIEMEDRMRRSMEARESKIIKLQEEIEQKGRENIEAKVKIEEYQSKLEEMQSNTLLLQSRVEQMETVKMEIDSLQAEKERIESRLLENTATSNAAVNRTELQRVTTKRADLEEDLEMTKNQLVAGNLGSLEERNNILSGVNQLMESEFQCSICTELFISATTLNCAHTFCKHCIEQWMKKKKECPICRCIINSHCKSLVLDSFVGKMFEKLPDDVQAKRREVLKDRKELEKNIEEHGSMSSGSDSLSSGAGGSSDSNVDGISWDGSNYSLDSADIALAADNDSASIQWPFDTFSPDGSRTGPGTSSERTSSASIAGLPGSLYGGYGHCFNCGARGHWAPGCPRR